jgi:hypothetical protein
MKFKKFGKALLISALSAGVVFSVSSCVQSYTVGYLYVTGTVTSESNGNGYVAGFKIDHNTGKLTPINGLNPPVPSGGANPVRAVLLSGSRFLYVLNQGATASGSADCTTVDPCQNSNITQFAIGANGVLTPQETFFSKGTNPIRMFADGAGTHIYVLDHDSPDNYLPAGTPAAQNGCAQALSGTLTCGDITAFTVDPTTGRLSLIQNLKVTITVGSNVENLAYFPVPVNPIDFVLQGSAVLTLSGTPATIDTVYPYAYNSSNGQLSSTLTGSDPIGNVYQATAIVSAANYIWVLDNEAPAAPNTTGAQSQILPFTLGSNDSLTSPSSGAIPDDPNQANPIYLVVESKGTWFYVANQGNPSTPTLPLSGIAGYVINGTGSQFLPTEIGGLPIGFGAGAGPVCLVEDPSDQFFYTANADAHTVTGQVLDHNAGTLTPLSQSSKVPNSYALTGPPTWCLVDGRTN